MMLNFPIKTLGGSRYWADRLVRCGWRIQQHIHTGHCRLLDPQDIRRAWGGFESCAAAMPALSEARHVVVMLHGLGRSRRCMARLEIALRRAGYATASLTYPSTRRGIAAHAAQLRQVLQGMTGVEEVSFVTYSLGGLVVRAALTHPLPIPVREVVMIGPPNQGAVLAAKMRDCPLFHAVWGPAGREIPEAAALPLPTVPVGIISGGLGRSRGINPLLDGDNDGILRVAETILPGAADRLLVPGYHAMLPGHPRSIAAVLTFLKTHHFAPPSSHGVPSRLGEQA